MPFVVKILVIICFGWLLAAWSRVLAQGLCSLNLRILNAVCTTLSLFKP